MKVDLISVNNIWNLSQVLKIYGTVYRELNRESCNEMQSMHVKPWNINYRKKYG